MALTLLEESESDGSDQQEEGLYWGKVGGLMGKDVDQLQQRMEGWSAEVHLTGQINIPGTQVGRDTPPPRVRSLTRVTSGVPIAQTRRPTCRVRSRAEAWGMVLYIRPSISQSCGTMGAKSSSSVLTDFSKMAHTA